MATRPLTRRPARGPARYCLLALAGACLSIATADDNYAVKPNDTLSDLAHQHGLTVRELAERNSLENTDKLRVGQKLIIPESGTSKEEPASSSLLPKGLNKVRVDPGKWSYIVIHHSASANASVKGMDYYHRVERHMENGLAYHFVIGNGHSMKDGEIAIGHRWTAQLDGGHLASEALNKKSIGICLVGNFDQDRPTKRQMDSLQALVGFLLARCRLSPDAVKTHQQINPIYTRCPGHNFPGKRFLKELESENSPGRRRFSQKFDLHRSGWDNMLRTAQARSAWVAPPPRPPQKKFRI
jgi:N-acetyl-anhydromuramyl-L-alanine amidase AmpD